MAAELPDSLWLVLRAREFLEVLKYLPVGTSRYLDKIICSSIGDSRRLVIPNIRWRS